MRDRTNLLLPGVQPALVAAVVKAAAGKPVVLVLMTGGVVDVSAFVVFFLHMFALEGGIQSRRGARLPYNSLRL